MAADVREQLPMPSGQRWDGGHLDRQSGSIHHISYPCRHPRPGFYTSHPKQTTPVSPLALILIRYLFFFLPHVNGQCFPDFGVNLLPSSTNMHAALKAWE